MLLRAECLCPPPPKFHMLIVLEVASLGAIRFTLGPKAWSHDGISAIILGGIQNDLAFAHILNEERPCENILRRQLPTSQGESPHQNPNLLAPRSYFLTSRNVRNKYLLFKPPSLGHFVMAAQAKTHVNILCFYLGWFLMISLHIMWTMQEFAVILQFPSWPSRST